MRAQGSTLDRLADKFKVGDGCWEWTAARIPKGYGCVQLGGKLCMAHRVVYEVLVGPIPEGHQIDHLCRNKACVRPDHLEAVTPRENSLRHTRLTTACPRGHDYDEANTRLDAAGRRICRRCQRDWARAKRAAR